MIPADLLACNPGHAQLLLLALIARGLIDTSPGTITRLQALHDADCLCLRTGIAQDCACNCEIEIHGTIYRYSALTAGRSKGSAGEHGQ